MKNGLISHGRRAWNWRICAIIAACLFVGGVGAASRLPWVLTPKHAYVVLPATTITEDDVQAVQWSPDGAYLLLAAAKPDAQIEDIAVGVNPTPARRGGASLLVWDRRTRHVRKVWSTDDPSVRVRQISWLHGSTCAYIVLNSTTEDPYREVFGLLALDATDGKFSWLPGMEQLTEAPSVVPSPLKPVAVTVFLNPPSATDPAGSGVANYWTLGPGGQVVRRQRTELDWTSRVEWDSEGSNWYVHVLKTKSKPAFTAGIAENGSLSPITVALYAEPTVPNPELLLHEKALVATQRKVKRTFHNLWLSSPEVTFHPDVLLTGDSRESQLSPSGDAVYYVEGGIAKVRPLLRLTDDQKRDLFAAAKKEAINNAKQCALGLLMYSGDADDLLPPGGSFGDVDPYIKSDDVMADFMYTPPSELNLTKIGNPATTPIGYINGPDGQAMAYADGHVVWIPNP